MTVHDKSVGGFYATHRHTETVLFQSFIQSEAGFASLDKPLKGDFKGKTGSAGDFGLCSWFLRSRKKL